jgi:hypothetical protein
MFRPDDDPERLKHIVIRDVVQTKECCIDGIQEILSTTFLYFQGHHNLTP